MTASPEPTDENAVQAEISFLEPALPQEIAPGASQTLTMIFTKPAGNTGVFKIVDFSVNIYF